MDASKLVVGDVVLLEVGHRVPADLRIVETNALEVDSSLLTGKYQPVRVTSEPVSEYVSYYNAPNIVFLGSTVAQGKGRGLVIATGNMPTLGAVSVALMDKTGILTMNKSHVAGVLMAQDVETDDEETKQFDGGLIADHESREKILAASFNIAALCNEANTAVEELASPRDDSAGRYSTIAGKSIDRGLLSWASQHIDMEELAAGRDIKIIIPFTHENMFSVAVVASRTKPGEAVVMAKGAPERVLAMCNSCVLGGCMRELTRDFRVDLQRMFDAEAEQGKRVVALAQCGPVNENETLHNLKDVNPNRGPSCLTFISVVALADPPREGARNMVEQLRGAGILVAMVTGDSVASATAVAHREGIYADTTTPVHTLNTLHGSLSPKPGDSRSIVITGEEVEQMSEVEWNYVFRHTEMVFARASIDHKLTIVKEFQKRGHIVSVTGDGVNDSAALHGADVGIATNGGSDVAREVAEVVLLRDDILAIPKAVKEGRLLFDNLQKAVLFALAGDCWSVLIPLLLAFCLGLPNPMTVFHMERSLAL
eukprot:gene31762-39239_t